MAARLTAIAREEAQERPRTARVAARATASAGPTVLTAGGQLLILFSGALLAGGDSALSNYGLMGVALGFALLLQGHRALTRHTTSTGSK